MDFQLLRYTTSTAGPFIYKFRAQKVAKGKYERDQRILSQAFQEKIHKRQHLQNKYHQEDIKTAGWIFENSRQIGSRWYVKLQDAAKSHNLVSKDLRNLLLDWHEAFKITILSTGSLDSFEVLKNFPTDDCGLQGLAQQLYEEIQDRVKDLVSNNMTMAGILEAKSCIVARLAELHAGNNIPGSGMCGNCTFCATNRNQTSGPTPQEDQTKRKQPYRTSRIVRGAVLWHRRYLRDLDRFCQIYEVVGRAKTVKAAWLQNSAEILTKVAFGIRSPDITSSGLASHKIFGSMVDWPYDVSTCN